MRNKISRRRATVFVFLFAALCWPAPRSSSAAAPFDQDDDGVEDSADCAPNDPRLSSTHVYYYDRDGDQTGDPLAPLTLCSTEPFPGTSPWGDDADDGDNKVTWRLVPKGARVLGVDFGEPAEAGGWRPELARELGAEAASVNFLWSLIETSPGNFNGPQAGLLPFIDDAYPAQGFALNLTVSPFAQTYLTTPADLTVGLEDGSLRVNDPRVINRFKNLLSHMRASMPNVRVASLQFGHEVDLFLRVKPDAQFWIDYIDFFRAARAHAKSLWGDSLSVGVTATWAGLLEEPQAGLMRYINAEADIVSVTYLPRAESFAAIDPARVAADVQRLIAAYYPKAISFQSVGYPSSPRLGSSTTRQSQFIRALFQVWDLYPTLIPYVGFVRLHDLPAARARDEAQSPHLPTDQASVVNAAAWLGSVGLRTREGSGAPKAAYHTLRHQTFERGWWQVKQPSSRSFLTGFTPEPYDQNPGGEIVEPALAEVSRAGGGQSDLIAYHFDHGVPWVEAYADTFAGDAPPYSQNLLKVWDAYRRHRPAHARTMVAVNPLGIPRRLLAPYWGVGEGFYHDENFNLVPTGTVQDYQDRLRPAPWDSYRLDSPQVKQAYLNYVRRVADYFEPEYLVTGIEVNLLLQEAPEQFDAYLELQRHVYDALHADPKYSNVKVMVSLAAEHFIEDELGMPVLIDGYQDPDLKAKQLDALRRLTPYTDVVGLSVYPIKTRYAGYQVPAWLFDNLLSAVRSVTDKPLAVTETGYPATPFYVKDQPIHGNPEKQQRYLRLLMTEMAKDGNVEFVVNFAVRDLVPAMNKWRARAAETPPFISSQLIEFYKYFEFIGVFNDDGSLRPGGEVLAQTFASAAHRPRNPTATLASPSGTVVAKLGVDSNNHLFHTLSRAGRTVLETSPLGITVDGIDLGSEIFDVRIASTNAVDENYPTRGVHRAAVNRYREYDVQIKRGSSGDASWSLVLRLYDDGLAYRHVVPGTGPRVVSGESSAWLVPAGSRLWYQNNTGNYESTYWQAAVGETDSDIGGPLTLQLPGDGGFLTLTEGALRDYSGLTYDADLGSRSFRAQFLDDAQWTVEGGSASPWRLAIVGATLNDLVNSDLVSNVNGPYDPMIFPQGANTSWIKPGRALWSWWSQRESSRSYDAQRQFVDYAVQLQIEYVLVDEDWDLGFSADGADAFARLAELTAYARGGGRNVGIWVWKELEELRSAGARNQFLTAVAAAGAVGVKIDHLSDARSESIEYVRLQESILREAAALRLMVNFHGVGKPTGLVRTWPNAITHEGVMGLETNVFWSIGYYVPPSHNAAVPFVRMIAGPGDYTPLTLDPQKLGSTTFAHQLATVGLFTSPVQHLAEHPALILSQPIALDVVKTIPTEWDETRVIDASAIGQLAVVARRKENRWWVFAVNGDASANATFDLPLSFSGAGEKVAGIISDTAPTILRRETRDVTASTVLRVDLLAGGGAVVVIDPK